MTEHPIIFKPHLAQAVHDGRKTQTRRIGSRYAKWQPGDVIWVKETWATQRQFDTCKPSELPAWASIKYLACENLGGLMVRPSIFMPRLASRMTALIVGVTHQQLQDISEADAIAEGIEMGQGFWLGGLHKVKDTPKVFATPVEAFADLWDGINSAPGTRWDDNPLVWAIEFVKANHDNT